MRTEIYSAGTVKKTKLHSSYVHSVPYPVVNVSNLISNFHELPYVDGHARSCPVVSEKFNLLQQLVNPLGTSACLERDLFNRTVEFVAQCLLGL